MRSVHQTAGNGLTERPNAGATKQQRRCADLEVGRAVFHMIAVTSAMLYYYFTDLVGAIVLLVLGALFTALDVGRTRATWFHRLIPGFVLRMVRPREEKRLSAITQFIMAATLIDAIYLSVGLNKDAVLAAVMFVGFGDPLARLIGMSVRSPELFGTGRTLAGSATFFVVGVMAALVVGRLVGASITPLQLLVGGAILTGIELVSRGWDNFHIPFFGSLVMIVLGWAS